MKSRNKISVQEKTLENIVSRAHYTTMQMIYRANNRKDKAKGDPKIGGHPATCASSIHIMGAIHLLAKTGFDIVTNKPHASPSDHAYNYLLDLFLEKDFSKMTLERCNTALSGLRKFSQDGQPVLQSYHSTYDPDHYNFLPTGSVGIPAVNSGYLALAYRYARQHGYVVPDAHFWCVIGDAEFKEGSLSEAAPDLAARELGNLTWVLDYNRQGLDGHRIINHEIFDGTDEKRVERVMIASGWDVIQVRHGKLRREFFNKKHGETFKLWLEEGLSDYELQALLQVEKAEELKSYVKENHSELETFLEEISAEDLQRAIHDLGGHDILAVAEALEESRENPNKPCMVIVHTKKGWGLDMEAMAGNHSYLLGQNEIDNFKKNQGIAENNLFERFSDDTEEGKFLRGRGEQIYKEILAQEDLRSRNQEKLLKAATEFGEPHDSMDINLKLASFPHTQWMLGQLTAKLTRIANTPLDESELAEGQKPLTNDEKVWKLPAELLVTMAPDVGTTTNLNPAMDGKVFSASQTEEAEEELKVRDVKSPYLVPGEEADDRFLRFDIEECNVMSCMGSFGRMRDLLGIPLIPLMTIYDFFVKRAHDQFFYNLYWKSSFICVGTPSGITLSPEGAQHGWKSDFQIPHQITWEPFYCQELDWIVCDAIKRHLLNDNQGRTGVYIRNVTKGVEQKDFLKLLKTQVRFKAGLEQGTLLRPKSVDSQIGQDESLIPSIDDTQILEQLRKEVLSGAYQLINYEGYAGYEPGDNVVNIFAMGALGSEAIKASKELLERGIYANVIIVTSPDLLVGNLGQANDYSYLKDYLKVNANLHLRLKGENPGELKTLSGRRVPIVSVHDGEPGLLDNIGSIVGVKHEALAVRKHSVCGRPSEIYKFHGIDDEAIVTACGKVLSETALEEISLSQSTLEQLAGNQGQHVPNWRELWPEITRQ